MAKFAAKLGKLFSGLEHAHIRAQMTNENFTAMMEEAFRQAARSTSDERRLHIASLIANSLTAESISFVESKHLLRILGEVNDIEILLLRSYLNAAIGSDEEFLSKHRDVLRPAPIHMGSPPSDVQKRTLHDSYKQHLSRLGLLKEKFRVDSKTKMPTFDSSGSPVPESYQITSLGGLLLGHVGLAERAKQKKPA